MLLFDFAIKGIKDDIIFIKKDKEFQTEIIGELIKFSKNMKGGNKDFTKVLENPKNYLEGVLENLKQWYFTHSLLLLKKSYYNWDINSMLDIDKIESIIYKFISTRLSYGFSWNYIRSKMMNKKVDTRDYIKDLLSLDTKHTRKKYVVHVPIFLSSEFTNEKSFWLNNLMSGGSVLTAENCATKIEKKTLKNMCGFERETYYFVYETSQLDYSAAISETVRRAFPKKAAAITLFSRDIQIASDKKIVVMSEWKDKQFVYAESTSFSQGSDQLFWHDFFILPELKYKTILTTIKENSFKIKKLQNLMISQHQANNKTIEGRSINVATSMENINKFLDTFISPKKDVSKTAKNKMAQLENIFVSILKSDILLEKYVNKAFSIRKYYESNESDKKFVNDMEFLKSYFQNNKFKKYFW